mgnify:FL=1|jgi:hypothetical protein
MQGRHGGMGDRLGNKDEGNLAWGRKWRALERRGKDMIGRELENNHYNSISWL